MKTNTYIVLCYKWDDLVKCVGVFNSYRIADEFACQWELSGTQKLQAVIVEIETPQ